MRLHVINGYAAYFLLYCHIFKPLLIKSAGEGRSIYVRNLPFDATAEQLEEVFKKFGPIKHEGIQVRSNKVSIRQFF